MPRPGRARPFGDPDGTAEDAACRSVELGPVLPWRRRRGVLPLYTLFRLRHSHLSAGPVLVLDDNASWSWEQEFEYDYEYRDAEYD